MKDGKEEILKKLEKVKNNTENNQMKKDISEKIKNVSEGKTVNK